MTQTVGAERVIVALDRSTTEGNLALIQALAGTARWFKVGMRQYYAEGDAVLEAIRRSGAKLFLDLKLHDTPATVEAAARSLRSWAPELTTVHASGGAAVISAAVEGFDGLTRVLGVTVLTSLDLDDLSALWGIDARDSGGMAAVVKRIGSVAMSAGAAGLICAPLETAFLRAHLGDEPVLITPGIRPAGSALNDQKRVATPQDAIANGADLIVVGRPIHAAEQPRAAFAAICDTPTD